MSSSVVEADLPRPPMWRAPRGRAVRAILAATAVAGAVVATMPFPGRQVAAAGTNLITRAPYLTDLAATSVLVNLGTDTASAAPVVTYGTSPGCTGSTVAAASAGTYTGGSGTENRWRAKLTGLSADTDYCYGVTQNGTDLVAQIKPATYPALPASGFSTKFHTQPPSTSSSYTFTVIGDFGGGTSDEAKIMTRMGAANPRFVVTVGDNVYNSGSESEYGSLSPAPAGTGNLFAAQYWPQLGGGVPAFFAQGNHGFSGSAPLFADIPQDTTVTASSGHYAPEDYPATNTPPLADCGSHPPTNNSGTCSTGTGVYGSDYYAFSYGNARFYVLHSAWTDTDTRATCMALPPGQSDPSGGPYCADYINHWQTTSPEYMWLKADMEAHPSALKFAFFHYPLYADSGGQGTDYYTNNLGPTGSASLETLLASHGVDVVFNGHDHAYQRNFPMVSGSPMVSYVTGGGGDTLLNGSTCNPPGCAHAEQRWSFLTVSVSGSVVTVNPTDENGVVFDPVTYSNFSSNNGSINGVVTAPGGGGVVGAAVTCTCNGSMLQTVTGANGNYSLFAPAGSASLTASAPGYGNGSGSGTVTTNATVTVPMTLGPAAANTVVGRVTDQNTTLPLSGTTVSLDSGSPSTHADANGRYALTSSAGTHTVNATHVNYATQSASISLGGANQNPAVHDFTLLTAGTISGAVSDSHTSAPISGATVTATSGANAVTATTNTGGNYSLALSNGSWQVKASASGYTPFSNTSAINVTTGSSTPLNIALTPLAGTGYVKGTVTDSRTGAALDGSTISCSCGTSTIADFSGSYSLTVAAGTYTITVTNGPYASQSASVTVTSNGTTVQNFQLSAPSTGGGGGTGGGVQGSHVSGSGYWLVASDGGIFPFGNAGGYGSTGGIHLNQPIVGMAPTPNAGGYWLVATDGGIFPFGNAGGYGSTGGIHLNQPIVAMAPTLSGHGYWLVASDGGIFPFGDAGGYGSTGGMHLNSPIVGMARTPSGHGYWLVATDGGIFPFGDAGGYGSTGGIHLNQPIVAMAATPSGHGYWLAASDGGIFPFGDAAGYGSTGGTHLNSPIVGMTSTPDGGGYWLVATDGGIFPFGNAGGFGSTGGIHLNRPIVGMAVS